MKVAIGSRNPTKLEATKLAFEKVFPNESIEYVTIDAPSKISDQPMSDRESIRGATNRATYALKQLKADYGVGPEGGLQKVGNDWFETGWIVIVDKNGKKGIGSSIRMRVPASIMKHIHDGTELGIATDIVFQVKNSKDKLGFFGHMTKNAIDRAHGYRDGIISALTNFMHKDLF